MTISGRKLEASHAFEICELILSRGSAGWIQKAGNKSRFESEPARILRFVHVGW
jgi:hypothetical protein